jgi:RNA 3'-terminal phosphate cyclase
MIKALKAMFRRETAEERTARLEEERREGQRKVEAREKQIKIENALSFLKSYDDANERYLFDKHIGSKAHTLDSKKTTLSNRVNSLSTSIANNKARNTGHTVDFLISGGKRGNTARQIGARATRDARNQVNEQKVNDTNLELWVVKIVLALHNDGATTKKEREALLNSIVESKLEITK